MVFHIRKSKDSTYNSIYSIAVNSLGHAIDMFIVE